jgi:hypothetical protein
MNDYWNDPPEYPEVPECCEQEMDVDDQGNCRCAICGKTIECQPDPEPPEMPEFNWEDMTNEKPAANSTLPPLARSTLDVADCCVTLEEARGVIRRRERENARLREMLQKMYDAPNDCPCGPSDETLAIWEEARSILSNANCRTQSGANPATTDRVPGA